MYRKLEYGNEDIKVIELNYTKLRDMKLKVLVLDATTLTLDIFISFFFLYHPICQKFSESHTY